MLQNHLSTNTIELAMNNSGLRYQLDTMPCLSSCHLLCQFLACLSVYLLVGCHSQFSYLCEYVDLVSISVPQVFFRMERRWKWMTNFWYKEGRKGEIQDFSTQRTQIEFQKYQQTKPMANTIMKTKMMEQTEKITDQKYKHIEWIDM